MLAKLMVSTVTVYENEHLRPHPSYHGNATTVVTVLEFDSVELAQQAREKIERHPIKCGRTAYVYNTAIVL